MHMPYKKNSDLPDSVKNHLPSHAQDIYREAFNHALQQYKDREEEAAHKVAWAAVKKKYQKDKDGKWKSK